MAMARWSESLLKSRVDIDGIDIPSNLNADESYRVKDLLFHADGVCDTSDQVKKRRERLKKSLAEGPKSAAVREVAAAIEAELTEIEQDLAFAQSRRGKFILFMNDWSQSFHVQRKADRGLDGVALGAHPDQERVIAHGSVATHDALTRLVQLLTAHPPGVPIEYRIVVTG
jgi:hypothetical protein